jgi:acyl-coenzyme A thioesterase PaaI-like protein
VAERPGPARLCFGCGNANPHGLGMHFRFEEGRAVADFTIQRQFQGYPGRAHGGVVATMLDEAMSWAVYHAGAWSMTARMTARFRRAVPLVVPITATGWITRDRGRYLELRSELRDASGVLLADAEGLFVRVAGRQAEELREQYEASLAEA